MSHAHRMAGLLLAVALSQACEGKKLPAVEIASGETVKFVRANRGHELVLEKNGIEATVRLVGIYTFASSINEKSDISVYAKSSKDWVQKELGGKRVTLVLERKEPDRRGRYLGFIELGGEDINRKMIRVGHAVLYTEFPFSREVEYTTADTDARKSVRGMWGGTASIKRLGALRRTWAAVRRSKFDSSVNDPLLQ